MFDYLIAILYGAVQGLTEFLPVSSSGHLLILHKILPLPVINEIAFDVTLHLATLLAVVFYFRQDISGLIKNWALSFKNGNNERSKLGWLIIIATIPAGIAALLFDDLIETSLRSPFITASLLIIVGIMLVVIERVGRFEFDLDKLNWRSSLAIGAAQALALIPGVSRSGITIIAGIGAGLNREAAARFSFLLSVPIIALAALTKIPPLLTMTLSGNEIIILALSFLAAAISGFMAIKYFLAFVKKYHLDLFGYYRIIVGLMIIYYFLR